MKRVFLFWCLGTTALFAQSTAMGSRTMEGDWDASGAKTTKPIKTGTALPAACSSGEAFFKTDVAGGQNLYLCKPDNAWTQVGGGARSASITDMAPVAADSGLILVVNPSSPIHLTRVYCAVQGSASVVVNLDKRDGGNHRRRQRSASSGAGPHRHCERREQLDFCQRIQPMRRRIQLRRSGAYPGGDDVYERQRRRHGVELFGGLHRRLI